MNTKRKIFELILYILVCCCRQRSCAKHAAIQNCISFIFAGVLIGINIVFLRGPNDCFFSGGICDNLSWMNNISLPFECFNGRPNSCDDTRLGLIKTQLAAGVLMAVTCFIYLILYNAVALRVSRANRRQIPAAANAVMAPVYQQPLPSVINYQQQAYTNPPNLYQPSAPVMMPAYQQVSLGNNNGNYLQPNSYSTIYPKLSNDQF